MQPFGKGKPYTKYGYRDAGSGVFPCVARTLALLAAFRRQTWRAVMPSLLATLGTLAIMGYAEPPCTAIAPTTASAVMLTSRRTVAEGVTAETEREEVLKLE